MKTLVFAALAFTTSATVVCAQTTIFADNFDAYADQAAFAAVWNVGLVGGGGTLTTEQAFSPLQSIKQGTVAQQSSHDFPGTSGSNLNPLTWSFRFYDSTQSANLRQFATIRDNPAALVQLVALGTYNDTTLTKDRYTGLSATAAQLNTYYACRVAFAPGPNWFILNGPGAPTRSTGWHELTAVFKDTTVELFVDGVNALGGLTTSYANAPGVVSFDRVTIGSGLSSPNGVAYYDNVLVQVPEPSALALLGLGCLALASLKRRQ